MRPFQSATALLRISAGWLCAFGLTAADPASVEFFENRIRPVLVERCYECHSAQSESLKGGLRLDFKAGWEKGGASGSPSIIPGKPETSLLIQVVKGTAADVKVMPPKGGALQPEQIADLEAWIRVGAPDPQAFGLLLLVAVKFEPFFILLHPAPVALHKISDIEHALAFFGRRVHGHLELSLP
jgi:mono/diheme cytochrome c family protein